MHIVLTVNTAWNVVNFRRELVVALQRAGHHVTVVAPPDGSVDAVLALGCDFHPLPMRARGISPMGDLRMLARMLRLLRDQPKPDIVLGFTIKNNIWGAFAALWSGVLFIPNVTGLGSAFLSGGALGKVAETLTRLAFRALPLVFFQNADDRALFVERGIVSAEQAALLPGSGINLHHFAPASPRNGGEPTRFLMISRIMRDKGVREFVEAARTFRTLGQSASFQLLGQFDPEGSGGIAAAEFETWVKQGLIDYLGTVDDVRPHIAAADCVVLPSYREGTPRSLLEAAAVGRPLIATDVPGCRDLVQPGRTGFLCAPGSAGSLLAAFQKFDALPQARRAMLGKAARCLVETRYDVQRVIDSYLAAIDRLALPARADRPSRLRVSLSKAEKERSFSEPRDHTS